MNNQKSKGKKRKLSDVEESSSDDSSVKDDDIGSDKEGGDSKSDDDDDDDDEGSSSESSHCSFQSQSQSDSSESRDENCEKCAICLRYITNQQVGNPEGCDHLFCSICLIEWSKNSNVCPLDRQQFSIILVRENKNGEVAKKVPVEEPQAVRDDSSIFEHYDTVCEICGFGDREYILLLCDLCNRGFHTVCLTPPLENVPDEDEWYCPYCDDRREIHAEVGLPGYFDVPSTSRTLHRVQIVRTRLLERIRVTVNMIMENYVPHHSDLDSVDNVSLCSFYTVPPDSGETSVAENTDVNLQVQPAKRKTTKSRKRGSSTAKKSSSVRKKKATSKKKKTSSKGKSKTKKRKTRVRTTRTKKVKVENADGTITEKIVKTRTYKKRRKQKKKGQTVKALGTSRRGLRVKSVTTPKTVKGRLALTLGMVPPKKPGQLLPDIKVKPPNSHMSAIDLNRARAGIPKLHIFGPRDELQYYSSESDHEDLIGSNSGGVATIIPQRSNISRLRDRKKAALAFQSVPTSTASRPKPVVEPPTSEYVDILGSIMDSQALWHSKNTNVKINDDGSIEVIRDKDKSNSSSSVSGIENKQQNNKPVDIREGRSEGLITQAPMHPGAGSRPGDFRSNNRHTYGENRSGGQDNVFSPRSGQSSTSVNFNRFGAPARNDREGYTNYLNSMPRGPTPFCRGGPPLRFRMPPRQQLRRITIPVRNRLGWQREDEEGENDKEKEKIDKHKREEGSEQSQSKKEEEQEEEDIDLYSDIEANVEKGDNSEAEDSSHSYPALGPPPEPPAFLLGLEEDGDFDEDENKKKSEVYDPAEPCDSEDEMVIDENQEQSPIPENKNAERKVDCSSTSETEIQAKPSSEKISLHHRNDDDDDGDDGDDDDDDDDDEDCPIFSIYSSATREFSQKEEEERQKEIAEERRKIEEMKLQEEQKYDEIIEKAKSTETESPENIDFIGKEVNQVSENYQTNYKKKEETESNSFFDFELKTEKEFQKGNSPSAKTARESSRSRSKSITDEKFMDKRSSSTESEKVKKLRSPTNVGDKNYSSERKYKRLKRKSKSYNSESEEETKKGHRSDDDKENFEEIKVQSKIKKSEEKSEKDDESGSETVSHRVATGLEGLDVEEVSSDNDDEDEFEDKRSLSSLSLSELSNTSKTSRSPVQMKKKNKKKKKKIGKLKPGENYEEGEIDDSEKDNRLDESLEGDKNVSDETGNENVLKVSEKIRERSESTGSERQILGSKENKKIAKGKSKDKDLSWKKPSKKEKNYREGKKRSKERGRSKSGDRRKSKSLSPKKDRKKNRDRKKKTEKKKEIERYDVRKIVKNKEIRKTDAFGRDIVSKSRSISPSRSRTPVRGRSRNMLRRDSRSYSRSRSRSFRRGRSQLRRRYLRSRTRSRSKSIRSTRRSYSRSRSRSRSRKAKKKLKSKDRTKPRSRSRGRKSRSVSRGRRRSITRSRSRSPIPRIRSKKSGRPRRSWSHHLSKSPSFSPRRSRSISRSPIRMRRSYTRSISTTSWSRGRSPLPRTSSLEKLTVVLTTKDKKKKKKEGKKNRKEEKKRKKSGNCKEVFASGDNVLVSVNFRNNNSAGNNIISSEGRNTRMNSLSPVLETESSRKKKKGSDYENERVTKKSKKSNPISKKVVDVALSNTGQKRAKKLTRLSEKDAEVILNRKPVAVIDLDMSPYREQTPSPVNVVVVSDSGSGDEGKELTPQRPNARATPSMEVEVIQENVVSQSVNVSAPSSPIENGYVPAYGPKTPPEPQIKFSINKPQQLRQIANPLGDDDEEEVEEEEGDQRTESLDRRIEKELSTRNEAPHKGPNTPPTPRGPSTPKTPPSPQTSPDAYDPFEPTKSRSPSPSQADKEDHSSPKMDEKDDQTSGGVQDDGLNATVPNLVSENADKINDVILENPEDKAETLEKGESIIQADCPSNVISCQVTNTMVSDVPLNESPERKIGVIITTPQSKNQPPILQKPYAPVLKQLPMVSSASTAPPTSTNLTVASEVFSIPSPTKTSRSGATSTTQSVPMTGIQRLQHRLGSPVSRTPNSVKSTPEKRSTPRTEPNEVMPSGNHMIRNSSKRNGEQSKQPRPLQDNTNEAVDMTMDLEDSPYSPASSEGDDLFDPPVEPPKPSQSNSKPASSYKAGSKSTHRSPAKQLSKFDLLFGPCGPSVSPIKTGNKKATLKAPPKATAAPKVVTQKTSKKTATVTKKNTMNKMDEDQLRILDELPSSAVELQVKDKFLKKLNRQERVVDEVKTVLKPHYARKHITKEEYKDILRRSVPKICHSRSGEINPSKIQSLIEAYVKKFRHAKKKGINAVTKPKSKKTMFS